MPLVKSLKPRFPCATSIALHTVGVSIVSRSLKSDSVILNYSIFWSAFENKKELLTRETGDHALILMSASRPKMFMKDKDICKDILKEVTTKNSVYAYRPVQGKVKLKKLRIL